MSTISQPKRLSYPYKNPRQIFVDEMYVNDGTSFKKSFYKDRWSLMSYKEKTPYVKAAKEHNERLDKKFEKIKKKLWFFIKNDETETEKINETEFFIIVFIIALGIIFFSNF